MKSRVSALVDRQNVPRGPAIAIGMYLLMLILPQVFGGSVTDTNYLNIFQSFANLAPIAIAVGLTMILGEFDISVASTYTLGGVIAIKIGDSQGVLVGVLVAALAGILLGLIQGGIVSRLNISSVPVTLAGFLIIWGLAEIAGGGNGEQVVSSNYGPSESLTETVLTYFTMASLIVIGAAVVLHLLLGSTRLGRDLRAVGGDRRASAISGVRVPATIVATFAASGMIAGLGGSLQALSFTTMSPEVSFNPLLMGVIASIVGGVGIAGAKGSPLGIVCGVLALTTLQEIFVVIQVDADLATVLTGGFLLAIAIVSAPELTARLNKNFNRLPQALQRRRRESALDPSGI